ncbi:hypothetical protein BDV98DRAFT_586761 [Pterulicium gracile]|uniref:Uncharacterized protein n=1 Tax=Pterulicium gracile TaxID=1884261 RepID=A0A5C3Q679_9AGAR|nr:hypothetical protein BDV98DRAFT_586761 [Pterula gracilis]
MSMLEICQQLGVSKRHWNNIRTPICHNIQAARLDYNQDFKNQKSILEVQILGAILSNGGQEGAKGLIIRASKEVLSLHLGVMRRWSVCFQQSTKFLKLCNASAEVHPELNRFENHWDIKQIAKEYFRAFNTYQNCVKNPETYRGKNAPHCLPTPPSNNHTSPTPDGNQGFHVDDQPVAGPSQPRPSLQRRVVDSDAGEEELEEDEEEEEEEEEEVPVGKGKGKAKAKPAARERARRQ